MGKKKGGNRKKDDYWDEEFAEDAAAMGASTELGTNEGEAPQNFAKNTSDFGTLANVDEDEGDSLMALMSKAAKKKGKKNKRATADEDLDEVPVDAPAPAADDAEPEDEYDWAEKPKDKKGKKGRKDVDAGSQASDSRSATPLPEDGDGGEIKILSKKEKERLKKEKAKEAKKKAAANKKAATKADDDELDKILGLEQQDKPASETAKAEPAAADTTAAADDEDQEGESKNKKKKKKKGAKKAEVEEEAPLEAAAPKGKKKGGAPIAALRKMMEAQRAAEEEARRIEEEARLRAEEEERLAAEEERKKEEAKSRKKEKEKAKKEQLRKEGKLLTKAQKEAQQRAQLRLQQMIDAGVKVEGLMNKEGESKAKRPVYDNRKKKKGPQSQEEIARKEEEKKRLEEEKKRKEEEEAKKKAAEEEDVEDSWENAADSDEDKKEGAKDSWDQESEEEDVKDSWDASSGEEEEEKPKAAAVPAKAAPAEAAPAAASKEQPKPPAKTPAKAPAKAAVEESESEEESDEDDENSSEEDSSDYSDSDEDSSEEELTATQKQALKKKEEAAERRMQRHNQALAARSKDDLRSPIACILGHVDTGKCWGRDTPILMLDGSTRNVQDVQELDLVMGDDNTPRMVQPGSVIRGEGMLYRIVPAQGDGADPFVCNGDHILVLTITHRPYVHRKICTYNGVTEIKYAAKSFTIDLDTNRPMRQDHGEFATQELAMDALPEWQPLFWKCTVLEYLELVRLDRSISNLCSMFKPMKGVEFPASAGKPFTDAITQAFGFVPTLAQELYTAKLLGLWLADGSEDHQQISKDGSPAVAVRGQQAVMDFMHMWADSMKITCVKVFDQLSTSGNEIFWFKFGSQLQHLLNALGMIGNKKVPDIIMSSSLKHREAFLAGVIDGEGHLEVGSINDNGHVTAEYYEISNKYEHLLVELRRLARSIGIHVGNVLKSTFDYRILLSGEMMHTLNPYISLEHKQCAARLPEPWKLLCDNSWTFHVEEIGQGEYFGFTLDGNSRVLLGDYTVSHNTKLLDKIRQTNVQEGEAGGITQQIGATYFPGDAIKQKTAVLGEKAIGEDLKLPGLLIIDTPGHESFTNLRSRGSSLCNIAILVVDIMHGLEPQTLESIRLLRDRKTPFIVALNKIDRLFGWKAIPDNGFQDSLAQQSESVKREFETRVEKTILAFAEQGLNSTLYYNNKNFAKYVSLVPTSAHSGEGVPDMLNLLVNLTQTRMSDKLMYITELECTVLEVKVIEGLGTTIDVVLVNGWLREGDKIVVCGLNGPIVTQIRALLTPQPMRELRIKSAYVHHKEVKAALGIKISAPDLEKAIAGSRLLVCGPDDDEDDLKEEVMSDLTNLMSSIDRTGHGVWVQASTLGSLEALLEFLKVSKIPVSGINIGPVHKKDVHKASVMLEKAREFAVMLCFDVKVDKEAEELANDLGIKVFKAEIIYHLFDAFTAYHQQLLEQKRKDQAPQAVFPCVLKMVPQAIFNKKDPIIIGVDVVEGVLRIGTPICVVKTDPETKTKEIITLGKVTSMEQNHKSVEIVKRGGAGGGVAVKIECAVYETPKTYGRHFTETDELYSKITRQSIDILKESFRNDLSKEEWALVVKLKKFLGVD